MTGRTIGHYEILEKLGEGGMGVVYKARDTRLNRLVALKLLPSEKLNDEDRLRRFTQEARTASALNHPNIVTIHDITVESEAGVHFIVMEYVAGKTLDQLIPRKGMRLAEVLKISVQIADAIASAAAAGVIHRDIKPGNIMVTENGHVKVLDFGLAKLSERAAGNEQDTATLIDEPEHARTREGTVIGTVSYMSPEQAEGKPLDPRSDIFSFGAVLYEMVTGQRAFRGDTSMSTISSILRDDPQPAGQASPDVPRDLEKIIARCLRKDPGRRFQTMADVRVALLELKEESESGRIPAPAPASAGRPKRTAIYAASVAILGVAAVFLLLRSRQPIAPPTNQMRSVPFTSYSGVQRNPTFSPDGNQIAFSWNGGQGDTTSIYVKMIGTESSLRLTTGDDAFPAWAPDGRSIAFLRRVSDGMGLFLVSPLGGSERRVAMVKLAGRFCWTPDGRSILLPAIEQGSKATFPQIFVILVETGQMRALALDPNSAWFNPSLSADGNRLAMSRSRFNESGSEPYVADLTEGLSIKGAPRPIKTSQALNFPMTWSADGKEIFFVGGVVQASGRVFRVAADGGSPEHDVAMTSDGATDVALSARANRLAYSRSYNDYNVWSAPIAGPAKLGAPASFLSSTRGEWIRANSFAPDGKRFLFESDRSGKRTIWLSRGDEAGSSTLVPGDAFTTGSPAWSPDGKWVAFDTRRDGNPEVYVISSDGGAERRVTNHPRGDMVPSWSPDCKWVYFSSDRTGRFEIFKAPLEGGEAIQVTANGGWGSQPSPDGKFIYYSRTRGPATGTVNTLPRVALLRMPADGGPETQVLDGVVERGWTVTAEGVWFVRQEGAQQGGLCFFDFKSGKTTTALSIAKPLQVGLVVSPDGRRLFWNQLDSQNSEILLVESFH